MKECHSVSDVTDALGGIEQVAALTGRKYNAVSNWRAADSFPPNTFLILRSALEAAGYSAPASLWRMTEPAE